MYYCVTRTKMSRETELNFFLEKSEDLINSNYILADVKIVGVLKAIATSDMICALFKSCLNEFDYEEAKERYFVVSQYIAKDKRVFVLPESSKDIIAFVFSCLMDIDNKVVSLPNFLDKYFYEDGSSFSSYSLFVNQMIKPFVSTVKSLLEDIISGKVSDPNDAVKKIEDKKERIRREKEKERQKEKELQKKTYGENLKNVRRILLERKSYFQSSRISDIEKAERTLVIDELVSAIDSEKQDKITYAFLCYYYMAKTHLFKRKFKIKAIRSLLSSVVYEI